MMNTGVQSIALEFKREGFSSWLCHLVFLPFLKILGIDLTTLCLSFFKRKIGQFFWKTKSSSVEFGVICRLF